MFNQVSFQECLEEIGVRCFTSKDGNGGRRGGNSESNEAYFGFVRVEILDKLKCDIIKLGKQECPDSGIFGEFKLKKESEVDWKSVKEKKNIVLRILGVQNEKNFLTLPAFKILKGSSSIHSLENSEIYLNDHLENKELFGIEYKATKDERQHLVSVASFNSTCPSEQKIRNINCSIIHNFETDGRKRYRDIKETSWNINLIIKFKMYYFIVNDVKEGTGNSKIKKILIVPGSFFSGELSIEEAEILSQQKKPEDFGVILPGERFSLRYRPFFESSSINIHNGYGLYVGWVPKNKNPLINEIAQYKTIEELRRMA